MEVVGVDGVVTPVKGSELGNWMGMRLEVVSVV